MADAWSQQVAEALASPDKRASAAELLTAWAESFASGGHNSPAARRLFEAVAAPKPFKNESAARTGGAS